MSEYEDMSRKDLVIENMKFHTDITSLTKQRDALLAACKLVLPHLKALLNMVKDFGGENHGLGIDIETIKAAIKLCERK